MKSLNKFLNEDYKRNFIAAAKILLEKDPFISFWDLLAEHGIIEPIRSRRPTPQEIEETINSVLKNIPEANIEIIVNNDTHDIEEVYNKHIHNIRILHTCSILILK